MALWPTTEQSNVISMHSQGIVGAPARLHLEGGEVAELLVLILDGEVGVPDFETVAGPDEKGEAGDLSQVAHRRRDGHLAARAGQLLDDTEGPAHPPVVAAGVLAPGFVGKPAACGSCT